MSARVYSSSISPVKPAERISIGADGRLEEREQFKTISPAISRLKIEIEFDGELDAADIADVVRDHIEGMKP